MDVGRDSLGTMNNSTIRVSLSLIQFTLAICLVLVGLSMGISWLSLLGIALMVSDFRTPWTARKAAAVSVILALVILRIIQGRYPSMPYHLHWWDIAMFGGVWVGGVISTLRN